MYTYIYICIYIYIYICIYTYRERERSIYVYIFQNEIDADIHICTFIIEHRKTITTRVPSFVKTLYIYMYRSIYRSI